MKLGRLKIHKPIGSMGNFASWTGHMSGYWRWAFYWEPSFKGFGLIRSKSATGKNYPHFGGSLVTPIGAITLRTQPRWGK